MIRRYILYYKDGHKRTWLTPHGGTAFGRFINRTPKLIYKDGETWIALPNRAGKEKGWYHVSGPWNTFDYRLMRSFWMAKHTGLEKVWVEGNPESYFISRSRDSPFKDTAHAIRQIAESDIPERVLKPRKHDWTMIILIALAAFAIGFAMGGRVGP